MHVRTDGQQAACAQRKASGCVCIRTNAQPQHNHSTHTKQRQRTFLKPMSLAYSRKQRRQIIIAYLRITPATQCNSNVSLQATTARLAPAYSACAHIHTHTRAPRTRDCCRPAAQRHKARHTAAPATIQSPKRTTAAGAHTAAAGA